MQLLEEVSEGGKPATDRASFLPLLPEVQQLLERSSTREDVSSDALRGDNDAKPAATRLPRGAYPTLRTADDFNVRDVLERG
jgi:hypothetical protein